MDPVPNTCVIFDIDGTLVDSDGFEDALYRTALREVLGDVRLRASWAEYDNVTDAGLLRQICADNGLSASRAETSVRTRFGELVSAQLQTTESCSSTAGALAVWDELRADDRFALGIATGGWGHTTRMKLDAAGFSHEGIVLRCSDDSHVRTQIMAACRTALPPTDHTVYVGDGLWDLAAANSLGWRFIGVGQRLHGRCLRWIPDFLSSSFHDAFLSGFN